MAIDLDILEKQVHARIGAFEADEMLALIDHCRAAHNAAMEEAVKVADDLDPLEAECDWECNESIAYGVRAFVVAAIRKRKDGK